MFRRRVVAGVLLAGPVSRNSSAGRPCRGHQPRQRVDALPPGGGDDAIVVVHYSSTSMQSKQTLVVAGDAGPASGSQIVSMGTGTITILVIGGTTYIKGNAGGLQNLAGLSASQAADAAGQWMRRCYRGSGRRAGIAGAC